MSERYFSSLLKRCSSVIHPKTFKQYKEESLRNMDPSSVETMKVIIQRLNKMGTKSCSMDYGTIRGKFILDSLKKLNPSKFESYR